jgi:cation:H+ antiporter
MLSLLGIIAGIALLIAGGAALVSGASRIASGLGVSPMIIGLTIVGFGTSAPELVVNVLGALSGETDLAFGNVIGSNISNLALVLGAAAMIQSIEIKSKVIQKEIPLLLLMTTILTVMALDNWLAGHTSVISRSEAVILLLLFLIFMYMAVREVVFAGEKDTLLTEVSHVSVISDRTPARMRDWLLLVLGFALLFSGGQLTVKSSVSFAEFAGVSTAIIGLFVVAVGTSMPELVTSMIAAFRKESDLALGGIIGSNIFNTLIVLPAAAVAVPVPVPAGGIFDLAVSWLFTAMLFPIFFLRGARIGRPTGSVLLLAYIAYAVYRTNFSV